MYYLSQTAQTADRQRQLSMLKKPRITMYIILWFNLSGICFLAQLTESFSKVIKSDWKMLHLMQQVFKKPEISILQLSCIVTLSSYVMTNQFEQ